MSTFGGKIEEIPQISVDRFDGKNYSSKAFFLSHCHTDHMQGLSYAFFDSLKQTNRFLYTSEISRIILERMYSLDKHNIKELCPYLPVTVCFEDTTLLVTSIPAGHSPGSLMFLFEGKKRILYTGDYRIGKNDVQKFKFFYDTFNKVKMIDKIYLDTTFFLNTFLRFPKREASLRELCKIIKGIIDRGREYSVKILTSANYGYETCFKKIYEAVGMPVHVNQKGYSLYALIPEMDACVTLDGSITQIHSNCGEGFRTSCPFASNSTCVKLSAFRWTQVNLEEGISYYDDTRDMFFVCYSTHASYEEGRELVMFLKPREIEICVKHEDFHCNKEMKESIAELLSKVRTEEGKKVEINKTFNTTMMAKKKKLEDRSISEEYSYILSSPPRERRTFINQASIENSDSIETVAAPSTSNFVEKTTGMISGESEPDITLGERKLKPNLNTLNDDLEFKTVCQENYKLARKIDKFQDERTECVLENFEDAFVKDADDVILSFINLTPGDKNELSTSNNEKDNPNCSLEINKLFQEVDEMLKDSDQRIKTQSFYNLEDNEKRSQSLYNSAGQDISQSCFNIDDNVLLNIIDSPPKWTDKRSSDHESDII